MHGYIGKGTSTDYQQDIEMPRDEYCREAWNAVCNSGAVIEFDKFDLITWVNDEFSDLVGFQKETLVGKHHRTLCYEPYVQSEEYSRFWKKLRAGRFDRGVYPRRRRDGSELWLHATYTPLFRGNAVYRILKLATDVTAKVLLERALQKRESSLLDTVSDLSEIVNLISKITAQTNLLAINASIEAAHAGSAGLGFSVLANEMKRLADDTKAATDRAKSMLAGHTRKAIRC